MMIHKVCLLCVFCLQCLHYLHNVFQPRVTGAHFGSVIAVVPLFSLAQFEEDAIGVIHSEDKRTSAHPNDDPRSSAHWRSPYCYSSTV